MTRSKLWKVFCRGALCVCVVLALGSAARAETLFLACLDGSQEAPPVDTENSGWAVLWLNDDMTALYSYAEHTLESPTLSHIHRGAPGIAGPVVHGFRSPISPIEDTWTSDDTPSLTDSLDDLLNGNMYFNVHSMLHPGGEIRGQIYEWDGKSWCK